MRLYLRALLNPRMFIPLYRMVFQLFTRELIITTFACLIADLQGLLAFLATKSKQVNASHQWSLNIALKLSWYLLRQLLVPRAGILLLWV